MYPVASFSEEKKYWEIPSKFTENLVNISHKMQKGENEFPKHYVNVCIIATWTKNKLMIIILLLLSLLLLLVLLLLLLLLLLFQIFRTCPNLRKWKSKKSKSYGGCHRYHFQNWLSQTDFPFVNPFCSIQKLLTLQIFKKLSNGKIKLKKWNTKSCAKIVRVAAEKS